MALTLEQFQTLEAAAWLAGGVIGALMAGHVAVFFLACVFIRSVFMSFKNKSLGKLNAEGKSVLITGCDSGFGLGLAERLHERGFTVFATCLNLQSPGSARLRALASPRLHVVPCDVSSDDSVATCLRLVRDHCSHTGLWGLVNNAGQNFIGDIELTTMSQYLEIANINLFGMVRMCKAFLPLLRQAKGRVVNVTSVKGLFAIPANAAYTITKFGGEAFSDTLAQEARGCGARGAGGAGQLWRHHGLPGRPGVEEIEKVLRRPMGGGDAGGAGLLRRRSPAARDGERQEVGGHQPPEHRAGPGGDGGRAEQPLSPAPVPG